MPRTVSCETCGKEFVTDRVSRKVRFCSTACCGKSQVVAKSPLTCEACGETFLVYPSEFEKAARNGYRLRYCSRKCPARGRVKTTAGYIIVHIKADDPCAPMRDRMGYVMEHRIVMARHLDRPLLADEQVHHLNGVRDDNRIENLELWTLSHPRGQRVEDKLAWAEEIVARYRDHFRSDTSRRPLSSAP